MTEEDKYEVLEKIGHGSFGIIRKVRRKSDGYILCRKEISYVRMSQKEKEQLQAELSILKELRHPNIVAYYEREHLKASQDLHLYMEYCGNGDLGRVIRNLKLRNQFAEEEFVWSIFAQLVTALYRCHYGQDPPEVGRNVMGLGNNAKPLKSKQAQYMILHRDLKPENVFLGADNSVKLGDFGLSKILQSHDFASTYVGTPFYMSPEICAAERYTLYSDIWSLGCIIYELCAKEPPFNAKTHFDLIQKIKLGKVNSLPPVYSAELQKVINSCLKVNPNSRPDTAQLLNLPIVKLMRKEQEVVQLGQQMKAEKDLASKTLREAEERIKKLEAEKEAMRLEIDATVRREWEVKARLEIDRQVQQELENLRKTYEVEVNRRVAEEVAKEVASLRANSATKQPSSSSTHCSNCNEQLMQPPTRSSTPSQEAQNPQKSFSTAGSASDFPSGTDISSLSLDSPVPEKQDGFNPTSAKLNSNAKPLKRSSRTPFARAKTMCAAAVASPMDVQMADPSPMSIASLSLSPRRTGAAQKQGVGVPRQNIFAAAAADRWQPEVIDSYPTFSSDEEDPHHDGEDEAEDVDDDIPPSPTLAAKRPLGSATGGVILKEKNDPFKAGRLLNRRPGLPSRKTLPNGRLVSDPASLFPSSMAAGNAASAAAVKSRPQSAVPVIAASPTRRAPTKAPGNTAETGSPARKPATTATTHSVFKSKKGAQSDEMVKTAIRKNMNLQGRTLVELSQARVGGPERSSGDGEAAKKPGSDISCGVGVAPKAADREREVVWDPELDEMPSPFLVRGTKAVRQTLGAR